MHLRTEALLAKAGRGIPLGSRRLLIDVPLRQRWALEPEHAPPSNAVGIQSTLARLAFAGPRIAVLLCTCNGESYLAEQLLSIATQTHRNWKVWVSDDGSQDATLGIIRDFERPWGRDRLTLQAGPAQGFAANFLSLVCNPEIQADYYAYCDQDDVWETDKLQRAVDCLKTVPAGVPALYCGRTRLVDANEDHLGFSPLFSRPPSFANALMQNIGGGNTMLFNAAARKLLCEAGKDIKVASHDWWAYIVVSGCGGQVFYDSRASLRYRQHGANMVGSNMGMAARLARIRMLWRGRFRYWHDLNIQALQPLRARLTPENQKILDQFSTARERWLIPRLVGLKRCGVYRQTMLGNLGLFAAAVFRKI
jgi:glycosyltransferase involved in cell wall biosynthesis